MMPQKHFNIITGQIKNDYFSNSVARCYSSHYNRINANIRQQAHKVIPKVRKLGKSYDSKKYIYSYEDITKIKQEPKVIENEENRCSLINASKASFNLINHESRVGRGSKWDETKKRAPLSKYNQLNHVNFQNYRPEYSEKLEKNGKQFHRRRNLCLDLCDIEKTYGAGKLFRRFK